MQNKLFKVQQNLQELSNVGKCTKLSTHGVQTSINHLKKLNEDKRKCLIKKKEDVYELVCIFPRILHTSKLTKGHLLK